MADQAAIVQELYNRIGTLPPDKAAIVQELANRFGVAANAGSQMRGSALGQAREMMDFQDQSPDTGPKRGFHFGDVLDAVNPMRIARDYADHMNHPYETASGAPGGGSLAELLPVTPAIQTVEQIQNRDFGGAASTALGTAAQIAIPIGAGKLLGAGGRLAGRAVSAEGRNLAADTLRASAEKNIDTAINPTTRINKALVRDKIAPGILDRGIRASSLADLQEQAQAGMDKHGATIDDIFEKHAKAGTKLDPAPILQALEAEKQDYMVAGQKINPAYVDKLGELQTQLGHIRDMSGGDIPLEDLRRVKQINDEIVAKSKGAFALPPDAQSAVAAHKLYGNSIRSAFADSVPELVDPSREFNFHADLDKVVGDSLLRKTGQRAPLTQKFGEVIGTGVGSHFGPLGAIAGNKIGGALGRLENSTIWNTLSGQVKNEVADYLRVGNQAGALLTIAKATRGAPAAAAAASAAPQSQPGLTLQPGAPGSPGGPVAVPGAAGIVAAPPVPVTPLGLQPGAPGSPGGPVAVPGAARVVGVAPETATPQGSLALKARTVPVSEGELNATIQANTGGSVGGGEPLPRAGRSGEETTGTGASGTGSDTTIKVAGKPGGGYKASYKLKELEDLQPSHSGLTFEANRKYGPGVQQRDYANAANQGKIVNWSSPAEFDPTYHISDNPDATNGPPAIDSSGNVLGGNGRVNILQRVYSLNKPGAAAYRALLEQKAGQFGLDPAQVRSMKRPVLVREIHDSELGGAPIQHAIADFNVKPTAELTPAERAISDSRRVSSDTLEHVAARLEAKGSDATVAQILEGKGGLEVLDRLVSDGVVSPQERAAFADNEELTEAGRDRVAALMVGRFFESPKQLETVPASIRNQVERIAAPLAQVESSPEWSLTPHVRQALNIIDAADKLHVRNLDDFIKQDGLFGAEKYSPEAITLAHALKGMKAEALKRAARQYAEDASYANKGNALFGANPTPRSSFDAAFVNPAPAAAAGPIANALATVPDANALGRSKNKN